MKWPWPKKIMLYDPDIHIQGVKKSIKSSLICYFFPGENIKRYIRECELKSMHVRRATVLEKGGVKMPAESSVIQDVVLWGAALDKVQVLKLLIS